MIRIAVLGASGLIGHALAQDLARHGHAVIAMARHFTAAQRQGLEHAVEIPLADLDDATLAQLLRGTDMVVNCVGILQDGPGGSTDAVHRHFTTRLAAICAGTGAWLVHVSMPGDAAGDTTAFSRSKRAAEQAIIASGAPYAILRPGFVVGANAYGGSALLRALAVLPLRLSRRDTATPFAAIAMADITATVALLAQRRQQGQPAPQASWDMMEAQAGTLGDMLEIFRRQLGGPAPLLPLPRPAMTLGARLGDAGAWLGWKPPVRSTALREMRRGVGGDPGPWMAATGINPIPRAKMLAPATVQERWFARLYLLKALALVTLVIFWCASGLIALTVAFDTARATLLAHGWPFGLATDVTVASSLVDVGVGLAIAFRRTSRFGLVAGILVSLGYMTGAAILTPDLWLEPLGALVKTGPAIALMLVALATLDDR